MFSTTPTSLCRNPKSRFHPQSFEPRGLMHQLNPHKQQPEFQNTKTEQTYVHPLIKSPSLSSKSLEMCTESLGNETGCGGVSDLDVFSYHALEKPSPCRVNYLAKNKGKSEKIKMRRDFPPPLTSISGNDGVRVHVQSHRECGRLVIKAFNFSCCTNYFHVERENGRLRISLLRDGESNYENEEGVKEEYGKGDAKDFYEDDDGGKIGDWSRCNGERSGKSESKQLSLGICVVIS